MNAEETKTTDGTNGTEQTSGEIVNSEGTGEETAGAGHEAEAKGETTEEQNTEGKTGEEQWPEVTPEQRAVFEKRLGKEVAKTKAAQDEKAKLEARVSELTASVEEGKRAADAHIPVHPDWTAKEDLNLIRKANELETELSGLQENWDGVESDDPAKARTAKQVQQRFAKASAELAAIKERADTAYKTSQRQFVEDAKLGRQIRMEREAAKRKAEEARAKGGDAGKTAGLTSLGTGGKPGTPAPKKAGGVDERKLPKGPRSVMDVVAAMS